MTIIRLINADRAEVAYEINTSVGLESIGAGNPGAEGFFAAFDPGGVRGGACGVEQRRADGAANDRRRRKRCPIFFGCLDCREL
jgi:hypothetical protein